MSGVLGTFRIRSGLWGVYGRVTKKANRTLVSDIPSIPTISFDDLQLVSVENAMVEPEELDIVEGDTTKILQR